MATLLRASTTRRLTSATIQLPQILQSSLPWQNQQRHFFGLGEVIGVIANPAETLRQLKESKDLLAKAREEVQLSKEAKKIPKKHTFSKLPGFHGRKAEQALLRKILSNAPKLNVVFGATSVGKTALLREVLATDDFYVVKFDLRISGFADLRTLYLALCEQFERFFDEMKDEEMDKQRLTFKHLILDLIEKEKPENGGYQVTVADIANLMESLQSCLLRYWEYDPPAKEAEKDENGEPIVAKEPVKKSLTQERSVEVPREAEQSNTITRTNTVDGKEVEEEVERVFKKRPVVFFMDEAHKLPALVDDQLSLKVFLDTLLVLTKQDRLCHVILSTSDSFFHHFLRSMNVGHHSQLLTIGDCTKEETKAYFHDELLPAVPEHLQSKISFEDVYEAFGGKLSHISDYMAAWVNAEGTMTPYTSAIFTQAYTLLHFHLTNTKFETFSPLTTATVGASKQNDDNDSARFSREHLVYVMRKLVDEPFSIPYFRLCREIGTEEVDSMIKTRILDLRWTKTVSPEQGWAERVWSEDGIERPIVLPMTRIVRKAMEVVLKEEGEMAKNSVKEKSDGKDGVEGKTEKKSK